MWDTSSLQPAGAFLSHDHPRLTLQTRAARTEQQDRKKWQSHSLSQPHGSLLYTSSPVMQITSHPRLAAPRYPCPETQSKAAYPASWASALGCGASAAGALQPQHQLSVGSFSEECLALGGGPSRGWSWAWWGHARSACADAIPVSTALSCSQHGHWCRPIPAQASLAVGPGYRPAPL